MLRKPFNKNLILEIRKIKVKLSLFAYRILSYWKWKNIYTIKPANLVHQYKFSYLLLSTLTTVNKEIRGSLAPISPTASSTLLIL